METTLQNMSQQLFDILDNSISLKCKENLSVNCNESCRDSDYIKNKQKLKSISRNINSLDNSDSVLLHAANETEQMFHSCAFKNTTININL